MPTKMKEYTVSEKGGKIDIEYMYSTQYTIRSMRGVLKIVLLFQGGSLNRENAFIGIGNNVPISIPIPLPEAKKKRNNVCYTL